VPRPLTSREKRTVKIGVIAAAAYLLLFYGSKGWRWLEAKRAECAEVAIEAEKLKLEILREEVKAKRLKTLREGSRIRLEGLREETVVGEARGAIQGAAQAAGFQIASSRESPGRGAGKELATFQLEGQGPAGAGLLFLHKLRTIGYPVAIDRLQFQAVAGDGKGQGQVRLSLTAVVLGFREWKSPEGSGV
jgi:hypothetical protein